MHATFIKQSEPIFRLYFHYWVSNIIFQDLLEFSAWLGSKQYVNHTSFILVDSNMIPHKNFWPLSQQPQPAFK